MLSGRMTPFVMASRTSATDLPEKSRRSAALPAADPAFCPVPAALPARRRPAVDLVWALLRPPDRDDDERELEERDDDDRDVPERELPERELPDRDEDERDEDDEDREPDEREPPERLPDEREDDEREPEDELREREDELLDPLFLEDPPLLPPDDSAMLFSSSCHGNDAVRVGTISCPLCR
jgi:hypothetical protein